MTTRTRTLIKFLIYWLAEVNILRGEGGESGEWAEHKKSRLELSNSTKASQFYGGECHVPAACYNITTHLAHIGRATHFFNTSIWIHVQLFAKIKTYLITQILLELLLLLLLWHGYGIGNAIWQRCSSYIWRWCRWRLMWNVLCIIWRYLRCWKQMENEANVSIRQITLAIIRMIHHIKVHTHTHTLAQIWGSKTPNHSCLTIYVVIWFFYIVFHVVTYRICGCCIRWDCRWYRWAYIECGFSCIICGCCCCCIWFSWKQRYTHLRVILIRLITNPIWPWIFG